MKKVKCFIRDESASHPGKWIVRPVHENFRLDSTAGSFNVICARLVGLTYAQYLRMCRDCFGAEIIGKGSTYPVAYFKRSAELDALIDFLNAQASVVLWEREHPDYEEHAQYVKEKNPKFYKAVTGNE
jgi:hypothetical protein